MDIVNRIAGMLERNGTDLYGGEAVTQTQHALQCAALAEKDGASAQLITASLLHDIGHLFMYMAIPDESLNVIVKAKKEERPYFQVERELLGFDYAKAGGYMMQRWQLPSSLR